MIPVAEALKTVLENVPRVGAERVDLFRARGRVLAEEVRSARDVPAFANAAMDGYAVRSSDVAAACAERPVRLRVIETVAAGKVPSLRVGAGTATRIMTGAVLPEGADAVVRVEDTEGMVETVDVQAVVAVGDNVRSAGEDLRSGMFLFPAGRVLRPADIGVLASAGRTLVRVSRRVRVAIVATGDELVDAGPSPRPGQVVNSNEYNLAAAVEEEGGEAFRMGIVPDRPGELAEVFRDALGADLVLSTGGVSMGSFDYVRETLRGIGYEERFWRVSQKPGKPLTYGTCGGIPVFGLPGNPVSALVCFYLYVLPVMRRMSGRPDIHLPSLEATVAEPIRKSADRTEFVRCVLDGPLHDARIRSTGSQSSGVLRSLTTGDALLIGHLEKTVLEEGSRVRVVLLCPGAGAVAAPF